MAETQRIALAESIELEAPGLQPLEAHAAHVEWTCADGQVTALHLDIKVSFEAWQWIDMGGWFNMPPSVRGPSFVSDFQPGPQVEIEARLHPDHLAIVADATEEAAVRALFAEGPHAALLKRTESWLGMYVKQQRGPAKTGFQTRHSQVEGGLPSRVDEQPTIVDV